MRMHRMCESRIYKGGMRRLRILKHAMCTCGISKNEFVKAKCVSAECSGMQKCKLCKSEMVKRGMLKCKICKDCVSVECISAVEIQSPQHGGMTHL